MTFQQIIIPASPDNRSVAYATENAFLDAAFPVPFEVDNEFYYSVQNFVDRRSQGEDDEALIVLLYKANVAKFAQNLDLADLLLGTYGKILVSERNPNLGPVLMLVREMLAATRYTILGMLNYWSIRIMQAWVETIAFFRVQIHQATVDVNRAFKYLMGEREERELPTPAPAQQEEEPQQRPTKYIPPTRQPGNNSNFRSSGYSGNRSFRSNHTMNTTGWTRGDEVGTRRARTTDWSRRSTEFNPDEGRREGWDDQDQGR